jgi:LysR family transcriptional activator of nhaA
MDWINYHHLLYFWVTAREGSITRASERLRLAQPTVSGQIQSLEKAVGEKLFLRQGRRLVLTETGKLVLRYADQIFTVGQELVDTLRNRPTDGRTIVAVGVADSLPKLVAHRLLRPVLDDESVHLICREGPAERLLEDMAAYDLDVVLSDTPVSRDEAPRSAHQLLGESPVALYGQRDLVARLRPDFPRSLNGAPLLLPTAATELRRAVDGWLKSSGATPRIVAEFDDSALMKTFGQDGAGLFPAPTCVQGEILRQTGAAPLGEIPGVRMPFYALTVDRKLQNPVVQVIVDGARERLAALIGASA